MSDPRFGVGEDVVARTEDGWNGRVVRIGAIVPPSARQPWFGYHAGDGWDEQYFREDELDPL